MVIIIKLQAEVSVTNYISNYTLGSRAFPEVFTYFYLPSNDVNGWFLGTCKKLLIY